MAQFMEDSFQFGSINFSLYPTSTLGTTISRVPGNFI